MDNKEFINAIYPKTKEVVISLYKREDKLMMVPFNNIDGKIDFKMKINFDRLKIHYDEKLKLIDKLSGDTFKIEKDVIEIPMDKRFFRILFLEKEQRR